MKTLLKKLIAGEEGATMVEYALMVALVAAGLIGVVLLMKDAIGSQLNNASAAVRDI